MASVSAQADTWSRSLLSTVLTKHSSWTATSSSFLLVASRRVHTPSARPTLATTASWRSGTKLSCWSPSNRTQQSPISSRTPRAVSSSSARTLSHDFRAGTGTSLKGLYTQFRQRIFSSGFTAVGHPRRRVPSRLPWPGWTGFVSWNFKHSVNLSGATPRRSAISSASSCRSTSSSPTASSTPIGGISAIAPGRKSDLAKVGLRAMIGGAIASWTTATIAGILYV